MKGFFRILSIPAVKYSLLAILVAGVGVLLYWNYGMISENVAAQEHIQQRETAVIEQQKAIKEIVKLYREVNGRYPGSMDEIIEFAHNGFKLEEGNVYDPNNLGKVKEVRPGAGNIDEKYGKFSPDTIWEVPSYHVLMAATLDTLPTFDNIKIDKIYIRDIVLDSLSTDEINNLRYIANSDKKEFQIDTVNGRFRCHAPYIDFIDTETYSQAFWNHIEAKFDNFVKNTEGYDDMRKKMAADGAYTAITSKDEEGNAKYHIGDDKNGNRIDIDIEYFGVTVGSLEKVSLDGSWEDQRSKQ